MNKVLHSAELVPCRVTEMLLVTIFRVKEIVGMAYKILNLTAATD